MRANPVALGYGSQPIHGKESMENYVGTPSAAGARFVALAETRLKEDSRPARFAGRSVPSPPLIGYAP